MTNDDCVLITQQVHRDLKMDNIMVASDGRIVLADFGTAARMTTLGTIKVQYGQSVGGNVSHLAPEVNNGAAKVAKLCGEGDVTISFARQSVFAAGVVMHEIATGEHPIEGYPGTIQHVEALMMMSPVITYAHVYF